MKKFLLLLGIVSTLTMGAYQMIPEQVSVGSSKPDASASLHLTGVTKGFIPNKLTTTQRNAIPSPARGLLIYNTNLDEVQLYNGSGWITVGAGGAGGVDAWATATVYAVDDVVILNQELYLCQNNHTSGVFATDLANGDWLIISDDVSSTGTITDTAIPRYVGTSGNVIDSSGVTIDNSNNVAGASSLAIGGSLDTSSILDAVSTSKGTRPCPSMGEVQRDAIGTPATGLCIFNTTTNTLNIYNGTAWVSAGGGLSSWETAKPYKIGDIVIESKQIYRALTDHTSGTFSTDLAASRWEALPQELKTDSNVQFANLNATGTTTLNTGLTGPLKASSGVVSSSAIDLASEVTGTLPIANGGTGSATQNFVDLTTNQTVAGEKTFSNTLKSDSIQTTGSSGVVIKNSSGTTVADFGPANTTNASIAGGLNAGGNIAAAGTVTGSNLSGTNTGDTEIGNDAGNIGVAKEFDFPNSQVVQTDSTNKKFRIESGNNNELYNGGFEADALAIGWTISNATSSSSTTRIEGSKSLSLALTGALSLSQSSTINAAQKSGVQMVSSIWVNSSDISDLQLCSLKNGSEDKCTVTGGYTQGSGWRQLTVSFLGDSTSNGLKLKSTDTSGTVLVDQAYVGIGSPNVDFTPDMVYSAKVSSTGVVSDENTDWINGDCSLSTATFTCTFNSGIFTVAPNCVSVTRNTGTTADVSTGTSTTTSAATIQTNNNGVTSAQPFTLVCQKQGADYKTSKAYVASSSDTDWVSYSPTLVGFGSPTGVDFKWKRQGSDIIVKGYFISGTSTATQARIPLPNSLLVSPTVQTTPKTHWGEYFREIAAGSTANGGTILPVVSQNYVVFGAVTTFGSATTTDSLSAQNGSTIAASGTLMSVSFTAPIQGWQDSGVIVGSFQGYNETPGVSAPKLYSFTVDSAGGVASDLGDLVNGDCTNANPNVCTLNSGKLTTSINCTGATASAANAGFVTLASTTGTISVQAWNTAFAASNGTYSKKIICHGY